MRNSVITPIAAGVLLALAGAAHAATKTDSFVGLGDGFQELRHRRAGSESRFVRRHERSDREFDDQRQLHERHDL